MLILSPNTLTLQTNQRAPRLRERAHASAHALKLAATTVVVALVDELDEQIETRVHIEAVIGRRRVDRASRAGIDAKIAIFAINRDPSPQPSRRPRHRGLRRSRPKRRHRRSRRQTRCRLRRRLRRWRSDRRRGRARHLYYHRRSRHRHRRIRTNANIQIECRGGRGRKGRQQRSNPPEIAAVGFIVLLRFSLIDASGSNRPAGVRAVQTERLFGP